MCSMPLPNTSASLPPNRRLSPLDRLIAAADQAARTLLVPSVSNRPYPASGLPESVASQEGRKHVAGLMRVNHAGEIAAQALYQGQALVAGADATRQSLLEAGREETDHLAWCEQRVKELGGSTSLLSPLWYCGSFAIGALAGLASDRASLSFVAETERQVVDHLSTHLQELPTGDQRTKAIIQKMRDDEARHGHNAINAGGVPLPSFARALMRMTAKLMTRTAYWI
jgi:ubiquinone biosynthesis monooxygenase Coq7